VHSDRVSDPAQKRLYAELFQLVGDNRLVLVKPEEAPLPETAIPRNLDAMMAARERVRAERSAKRTRNPPKAR
jgi:hypothetical protein